MHAINKSNDRYAFYSNKQVAWHGLGTVVEGSKTSKEVIELANLNYNVRLAEIHALIKEVEREEIKNTNIFCKRGKETKYFTTEQIHSNFLTYRDDTYETFGIVGNRYNIIQNSEAFDFFDDIAKDGIVTFETAGALGKGETIFITAKLSENFKVHGTDLIENYLVLTNNHNGKSAITIYFTTVRVVCYNTLMMSLKEAKNKITIKHTKSSSEKLKVIKNLLGITKNNFKDYETYFNRLVEQKIDDSMFNKLTNNLLISEEILKEHSNNDIILNKFLSTQVKNKIKLFKDIYYYDDTLQNELCKNTLYGFLNTTTAFTNHYQNNNFEDFFEGNVEKLNKKAILLTETILN